MTIDLELTGARRQVTVRREGEGWVAAVGGRELAVSLTPAADRWLMRIGPAEAGHYEGPAEAGHDDHGVSGSSRTIYDIAFERGSDARLLVHVNGVAVPITISDPRRRWRRGADAHADRDGPLVVTAPMPGRIVKVLVKPGETVQPRQGLVVIEAMKMENELRASRSGRVTELRVAEGTSVEANAILVVLE